MFSGLRHNSGVAGGSRQPTYSIRVMPICQRGPGSPTVGHFQVGAFVVVLAVDDLTLQMAFSLAS